MNKTILGLMRVSSIEECEAIINKALELGITVFDTADIYGKSEEIIGAVLLKNPSLREKMIIQTKFGICNRYYDSSKEHILESVNNSLKKLNTNYVDVLLIHRPDILADIKEINEAFTILFEEGKVKKFGVSNMSMNQIELYRRNIDFPLVVDQIELSVVHALLVDEYFNVNMTNYRETGLFEYLKMNDIAIQAWSPLSINLTEGCFIDNPKYVKLNDELEALANKYHVSKSAIALSWIKQLPFDVTPIIGTTKVQRLEEMVQFVELEKEEWYRLYLSNNRMLP